jgi:hypothetical protein
VIVPFARSFTIHPTLTEEHWKRAHGDADLSEFLDKFSGWASLASFVVRMRLLGSPAVLTLIAPPIAADTPEELLRDQRVFAKFAKTIIPSISSQPELIETVIHGVEHCIAEIKKPSSQGAGLFKVFLDGMLAAKEYEARDGQLIHAAAERELLALYEAYNAKHSAALDALVNFASLDEMTWMGAYSRVVAGEQHIYVKEEDGSFTFFEPSFEPSQS